MIQNSVLISIAFQIYCYCYLLKFKTTKSLCLRWQEIYQNKISSIVLFIQSKHIINNKKQSQTWFITSLYIYLIFCFSVDEFSFPLPLSLSFLPSSASFSQNPWQYHYYKYPIILLTVLNRLYLAILLQHLACNF